MVALRLTQITPPDATPDQLRQRVKAAWSAVPQEHIRSLFESMPRRVAALRLPTRLSDVLIYRARALCVLGGYLVPSGIEPRSSGLEADALTTRLPTALPTKESYSQSIDSTIEGGRR
ncbi:hypothetical protein TNCV_1471941 [Trichonephila clavipes]|nr:hypothetical protein TNCV_1471941 [Trichonephila clavipes]